MGVSAIRGGGLPSRRLGGQTLDTDAAQLAQIVELAVLPGRNQRCRRPPPPGFSSSFRPALTDLSTLDIPLHLLGVKHGTILAGVLVMAVRDLMAHTRHAPHRRPIRSSMETWQATPSSAATATERSISLGPQAKTAVKERSFCKIRPHLSVHKAVTP